MRRSFFAIDKVLYLKILNLASKLGFELGGVKTSNGSGTTLSFEQAVPKFFGVITNRGQCPDTCNDYTLKFHPKDD